MALTSPKADLELLFGVLGGGSASGQSGTLIRGQLNKLVGELNNAKNTNERKIRLSVDTQATTKEFRSKLTSVVNTISSTNSFKIKVDKIEASDAIVKLRNEINDALKMLRVDTGFDVSVNADGSKSAIKQIAGDAEEAIKKAAQLKASIDEIESSSKLLDKSYNTAKNILGGEAAIGDDKTKFEEMRNAYVDMNAQLDAIKEKQKSGFAVSDEDVNRLRELTKETQNLVNGVLERAEAEKAAAKAAKEAAAAAKAKQESDEEAAKNSYEAIRATEKRKASLKDLETHVKNVGSYLDKVDVAIDIEDADNDSLTKLDELKKRYADLTIQLNTLRTMSNKGLLAQNANAEIERVRKAADEIKGLLDELYNPKVANTVIDDYDAFAEKYETAAKIADAKIGVSDDSNEREKLSFLNEKYNELNVVIERLRKTKNNGGVIASDDIKNAQKLLSLVRQLSLKRIDTERKQSKISPGTTEYNNALEKTNRLLSYVVTGEKEWTKAKNGNSSTAYTALAGYRNELKSLINALGEGKLSAEEFKKRFDNINSGFKSARAEIRAAGENTKTFGERLAGLAEKFNKWFTVSQVIMFAVRQIRKMITNVIELDSAMTELKKVTDETDAAYEKFFKNAAIRAKELGATLKDTINATASFTRLGYGIEDASTLADAAVVYKNVGDEIESIDDASASIISTMQAFGVEAQNVMTIVDKFNEVGNNFAISSGGIGEAMLRSASALHAAGNTIDESIALIATANTIVQDPDSVGTVLKTLSMYLRAAKTEAEDAGESTEGMANSVSELREELLLLTNNQVDVMQSDGQTFKSTYAILKELSSVWETLNDVTQANILEMIGGKRNANVTSALISNFNLAEKVVATSAASAGSALAENEKVLESVQGHINRMKAAFEGLSASVIDSDVLKFIIDVGTAIINITNSLFEVINALGGIKTILAGGSIVGIYKLLESGKIVSTLSGAIKVFTQFTTILGNGKAKFVELSAESNKFNAVVKAMQAAINAAGISMSSAFVGVAAAIGLVVAAVKIYQHFNPSFEELVASAEKARSEVSALESEIKTTKDRISELQQLAKDGTITIVEKDELDNLVRQNDLLEAQIALKKELAELSGGKAADSAREEIQYLINGVEGDEYSSIDGVLKMYKDTKAQYEEAVLAGNDGEAKRLSKDMSDILEGLSVRQDAIVSAYKFLDPQEDSELIRDVNLVLDKITVATGDAKTLSTIWDKVWSSDSPVNGAGEVAEKLKEAATAQKELNDELSKYGGYVDITNRPVLTKEDFAGTSWYDDIPEGDNVTLFSSTYRVSDFSDENGKRYSGTSAILVTPILPNGEILSEDELAEYVSTLIGDNGELDPSKDEKGIVMAVANEGDIETSTEKLDKLGAAASAANGEFLTLLQSVPAEEALEYLGELGYDVENMSFGDLANMFEQLTAVSTAASDADASFKSLYNTISALSEKKNLLSELETDIADGSISESALNALHEQYDSLDGIIVQYRLGLATAQDVYDAYKKLCEKDEKELLSATRWKIGLTEDYFNENIKGNAEMIKILGTYYTADFENYKELAKKKQEVDSVLIKSLGEDWADYYSTYASAIKTMAAKTYMSKSVFDRRGLAQEYGTYDDYVNAMTGGMLDTAFTLDNLAAKLRDIDISIKMPEGSSSSSKVDEYIADIDEYREAIERLNQTKIDVDTLDSKLEMAEDVREAISLRSQLLELYESEIGAQETLNKLRREGIAAGADKLRGMGFDVSYDASRDSFLINNLEHLNELEAATKGNHKTLQEATNELRKETEEYIEKLSELNENNQDGEKNWRSLAVSIREAKTEIVESLKSIATASSEALDNMQNVYDTLRSAADDYETNSGYLSIDTYQSLLELGPQYMQYLRDEKGALIITREKIEEVIAAKVEQLALDNAMAYVERLRLAMQKDSIEDLNELLYATTEATDATWGLVYANLALLDLDDEQQKAALHNIDAMRSLADNVREGLKFTYSKDSMDELINYTMDMLRDKIDQQIDALEDMKETYSELIDLKKESLDAAKEESDHQKDMAKQLKEIAKLQARIDILSLDTSREAQAERTKLAEELAELQDGLADSQRDYAIDQQKEALDKMQEDYESQKDNEIKALEETVSSEERVYAMAIKHIADNWDSLYDDLIDWNEEMGSVINREITQAWEEAALMVERYGGNVRDALNAVSSDDSSSGGLTVSNSGDYDHNSSIDDKVNVLVTRMKENSKKWLSISDSDKRSELNSENYGYAAQIGALLGKKIVYNPNTGTWHIGSLSGAKLYDKYAGVYHTGGIVGDKDGLKSNEVIAKLEKGEFIVPKSHLDAFMKTVNFIADAGKAIDTSSVRDMSLQHNADLIRSMTSVTNNRAGDIHFGDVYIYGANSDTVAKHREVNREFTNEVLRQLNIKR